MVIQGAVDVGEPSKARYSPVVVEPARPDADQCHAQSREPRNEELSRGREALSPPDVEQPASHLNGSKPAAHIPVDSILDDRRNGWGCTRNRLGIHVERPGPTRVGWSSQAP